MSVSVRSATGAESRAAKQRTRSLERAVRPLLPWIVDSDRYALARWIALEQILRRIEVRLAEAEDLAEHPVLLEKYRALGSLQLAYGAALGLTPKSRAELGRAVAGAEKDAAEGLLAEGRAARLRREADAHLIEAAARASTTIDAEPLDDSFAPAIARIQGGQPDGRAVASSPAEGPLK